MTKKSKGLGRGLDALLGGAADFADTVPNLIGFPNVLALNVLQAGKYQPRTRMDDGSLAELAASIKEQGVMQPILVRPVNNSRFEIIAGERRFRASQLAGLTEIPAKI